MEMKRMDKRVTNINVYGLEESIIASGYPMRTEAKMREVTEKDMKRAIRLGNAAQGSAHDNYLKGILVQFDLTFPQYAWQQLQRYHFIDFVSSQSKMHKITQMDIASQCNSYVDEVIIKHLEELIADYNAKETKTQDDYMRIISNTPMGLMLTARMTTNYLQLKTIYAQRRGHKLVEWAQFCKEIEELPYFKEIALQKYTRETE